VPYYHLVFTLPHQFNEMLPKYAKQVYSALFAASWHTIRAFAEDPKYLGAQNRHGGRAPLMGPTTLAAPAPSLHRAWWWLNAFAKMEALQIPEKVPLPKTGTEHGLSRKVYGRFKKTNPCAPTYRQKRPSKKSGWFLPSSLLLPLKQWSNTWEGIPTKLPSQTTGLFR
jgi:hypothetical protein